MSVDYDQVARYEAAIELLNSLRAVFESYEDDEKYGKECETRSFELMKEKQKLNPKDEVMVAKIREVYAPLAREFYNDTNNFTMTDEYLDDSVWDIKEDNKDSDDEVRRNR